MSFAGTVISWLGGISPKVDGLSGAKGGGAHRVHVAQRNRVVLARNNMVGGGTLAPAWPETLPQALIGRFVVIASRHIAAHAHACAIAVTLVSGNFLIWVQTPTMEFPKYPDSRVRATRA